MPTAVYFPLRVHRMVWTSGGIERTLETPWEEGWTQEQWNKAHIAACDAALKQYPPD